MGVQRPENLQRMKTSSRLLFPLLALLLSACAVTRAPQTAAPQGEEAKPAADDDSALPRVALTPDYFYGVLSAEIAAQRGAGGAGAQNYLEMAREARDPRLAQRAAELAMLSGQAKLASDALALWVEIDPSSREAHEQLFITLLRTGKLAESRPLIEGLLKNEPQRAAGVFVQLARLTARQPDKQAAYRLIDDLARAYPDLPEARFAVLATAAEAGKPDVVAQEFDRLALIAPQWDLPVAWQTDRLRRQDVKLAAAFLERELARRPQASLELKMAHPRLLVGLKQFDKARAEFNALLAANPGNADLLYAVGLLSYQLRDLDDAERKLSAALAAGHAEVGYLRLTLGQIAEDQGRAAEARRWYEQVPDGEYALQAQGRLAAQDSRAGHLAEALARLDGLGTTAQEKTQRALMQAQIAREGGRMDLAYQKLSIALQELPRTPELLYERALVADQLGNAGDAERDLRAYLQEKPDDVQGLNALGYTLANRTRRYKEALGYIEKAYKADPDNPMVLDSLGWVYYKLGRLPEALKYLEKAYAAFPDAEVAAHYGEVLWRAGRNVEARSVWDKAAAVDPKHEVLQETMHRLTRP